EPNPLFDHVTDPAWSKLLAFASGVLTEYEHHHVRRFLERVLQTPDYSSDKSSDKERIDRLAAWAPRVGAASVCLAELATYDVKPETLEPARKAHDLVLPLLEGKGAHTDTDTRIRIAKGFGTILDPRLQAGSPERWVLVPAGPFFRGS